MIPVTRQQILLGRQTYAPLLRAIHACGREARPAAAAYLDEHQHRSFGRNQVKLTDTITDLPRDDPQPLALKPLSARSPLRWRALRAARLPFAGPAGAAQNAIGANSAGAAERSAMEDSTHTECWAPDGLWKASGLEQQELPRALYVVATPIGNAADVTLRALWVLRNADCIAAEDTRVSAGLLRRYEIRTPLLALHQHNEKAASAQLMVRLKRGERVALVSDAGTPGISDPGALLVRSALSAGVRVVPIPGASSLTAAISAAGLQASSVRLIGFLPTRVQARRALLRQAAARDESFVLFEAPHRIDRTAQELSSCLEAQRRIVVARELTKRYETIVPTTAGELVRAVSQQGERGEFVVLVDAPAPSTAGQIVPDETTQRWLHALAQELPAARAAALISRVSGIARDLAYAQVLQAQAARTSKV
jgi:16S rRNA (cytidine1402-2'-O)-methyltransferase